MTCRGWRLPQGRRSWQSLLLPASQSPEGNASEVGGQRSYQWAGEWLCLGEGRGGEVKGRGEEVKRRGGEWEARGEVKGTRWEVEAKRREGRGVG